MKLIIQIPCFNEAETLPVALGALPKSLPGISTIEILIVDDGSTDNTAQVARDWGVDHVVRLPQNRGLATAFIAGLDSSLQHGADVIVNTDADNQYCADDLAGLVQPILDGKAEMVIGARPITEVEQFSPTKKLLQRFGSWVVRVVSGTGVPDAPSGFRAISREAAMKLNVFSSYTYTIETIIQAGHKGIATTSVPVRVNPDLRPSRLVRSISDYVRRSLTTIVRIFMVYRPVRFFFLLGSIPFGAGTLLGIRFLVSYFSGAGAGKVQSLILAAVLLLMGFSLFVLGLVADLISVNRKLLEKVDWRLRQVEEEMRRTRSSDESSGDAK